MNIFGFLRIIGGKLFGHGNFKLDRFVKFGKFNKLGSTRYQPDHGRYGGTFGSAYRLHGGTGSSRKEK